MYKFFDEEKNFEIHNKLCRIEENTKDIVKVLKSIQEEIIKSNYRKEDEDEFPDVDKIILESMKKRLLLHLSENIQPSVVNPQSLIVESEWIIEKSNNNNNFMFNDHERRISGLKTLLIKKKYNIDENNDPPKFIKLK